MRRPGLAASALAFAAAAVVSRSILRHTESRWQIAAFCAAACLLELAWPRRQRIGRLLGVLALGGSAAAGVLAVKARLEPANIAAARATAHQEARRIVAHLASR